MAAEKRAAAVKTTNRREGSRVALIHGDDEFRVATRARERLDRFLPEAERALGLDLVDGQADTVAEAVQSIRQTLNAVAGLGLFVSRKAVWLRDATFLNLSVLGRSRDVKACLAELGQCIRQGLPEGFFLLITAADVDGRTEFFKICETAAEVEEYALPKSSFQGERSALATVQACFREHRLEAGHEGVMEALVEKTGTGTRQILQEVAKLDVYLGDRRRVTMEDVEAVISPAREMISWQLSDAVGKRELPKALGILRQLLAQKESSIGLLMGLESYFRMLALLRELLDRRAIAGGGGRGSVDWSGLGDELRERIELAAGDKAQQNPLKLHPFVAAQRVQQAAAFTRGDIKRAQEALVKAHQQVVSGDLPDNLVMEFLLIRLCVKPSRR